MSRLDSITLPCIWFLLLNCSRTYIWFASRPNDSLFRFRTCRFDLILRWTLTNASMIWLQWLNANLGYLCLCISNKLLLNFFLCLSPYFINLFTFHFWSLFIIFFLTKIKLIFLRVVVSLYISCRIALKLS